jgi:hypothetical protein
MVMILVLDFGLVDGLGRIVTPKFAAEVMMSFICSHRNKNEPNALYPLGTPSGDKENTCDDDDIIILMVT